MRNEVKMPFGQCLQPGPQASDGADADAEELGRPVLLHPAPTKNTPAINRSNKATIFVFMEIPSLCTQGIWANSDLGTMATGTTGSCTAFADEQRELGGG